MISIVIYTLLVLILACTLPTFVLVIQFFIAGLHGLYNHYPKCKPYYPHVSILVPAWNEAEVIERTIERLMLIDYPHDSLRIYIIDDASTDNTTEIVDAKVKAYPDNVFYVRREKGGQGKCHTLNAGLKVVLSDSWAEAVMIIDADIEFERDTLFKMTRHLADPEVGAVTCYIKVDQFSGNFLNDCIASEYILAQAIARRGQNVTKTLACMAGGAQLHSRANIELIGGQIDTTTLAEDTVTTFLTQINHHRAIFESNAIVNAEEPTSLIDFWKQRFRWARGNIQVTSKFRHIWFRRNHPSRLGGIFFGLTWFSTVAMPFTMIISSLSLIALLFIDPSKSWTLLKLFYFLSSISYIFSTLLSFTIDPVTMRKSWFSALMFPGLVSLTIMGIAFLPDALSVIPIKYATTRSFSREDWLLLLIDSWACLCLFFSWLVYRLARAGAPELVVNVLLAIVGYGPMLCTITLLAFIAEFTQTSLVWQKTEKVIKPGVRKTRPYHSLPFDDVLAKDMRTERNLLRSEVLIILFMIILFVAIV